MLNLHSLAPKPKIVSLENLLHSVPSDTTTGDLYSMLCDAKYRYNVESTAYHQCLTIRHRDIVEHCLTLSNDRLACIVANLIADKNDSYIQELLKD